MCIKHDKGTRITVTLSCAVSMIVDIINSGKCEVFLTSMFLYSRMSEGIEANEGHLIKAIFPPFLKKICTWLI